VEGCIAQRGLPRTGPRMSSLFQVMRGHGYLIDLCALYLLIYYVSAHWSTTMTGSNSPGYLFAKTPAKTTRPDN
jgi:hypothetical protein